jgi:tetratricopeptide (TPR) repeat protein
VSDGLLGGILGEEDEKPDVEAQGAKSSAEAFAAAVAAKLADHDPEVARNTADFLNEQTQLLRVQKEHLKDEHAARLHYLLGQAREVDIRRFGLRLRVGFQLFLALIATLIGIGAVVMIRDAITSRSVVIESFDAPPALAARGVTGRVVAAGLLDELRRLQSATRADASKRDLSNAWTGEIKLAVPETGVSLGEISRILKSRFGHDLHIEGELVQTEAGGLMLTVRGDNVPAKSFTGTADQLGKLTTDAAGYVYAKSEPVLWAYYLTNRGHNQEAVEFSRTAVAGASKEDRPYLLNTWANAISNTGGPAQESLALYRAALKLKPDYWVGYNNVMQSLWIMGDEQGAWKAGMDMRAVAGGRPGRAPETYYQNWDLFTWNLGPWLTETVADAEATGGLGSSVGAVSGLAIADIQMRQHDLEAAELTLQTIKDDPDDPSIATMSHFVRARIAAEQSQPALAVSEAEAFQPGFANPAISSQWPGYQCWVAPIEEAAGHPDRADAVLKSAGSFVDCYRFRADILDGRGDWNGAQKAYAEAVALAPDLPAAYYSWGAALAKHGDLQGAATKLSDANSRGPNWADPLKAWGDVLVKQGNDSAALAKYDAALKLAPNWKELMAARGSVPKPAK